MLSFLPSPDALPPLDLALDCLPQEVCSFLAIFEKGVDPRQRPRREAGGHLLFVYSSASHLCLRRVAHPEKTAVARARRPLAQGLRTLEKMAGAGGGFYRCFAGGSLTASMSVASWFHFSAKSVNFFLRSGSAVSAATSIQRCARMRHSSGSSGIAHRATRGRSCPIKK
jgi:hypothetical protein